jgi:hypothetical protein
MPVRDDYDDDDRPSRSTNKFPPGVKAAGIIWIAFGALGLIQAVLSLISAGAQAAGGGGPAGSPYCGVGCGVLFALVFLMVGVQTVKGTAKSTLGNGIGSIIFGVLYLGLAAMVFVGSGFLPVGVDATMVIVMGAVVAVQGLALLLAGTLALMGKSAYEDWRVAQGLVRKPKRKTQEERDYDDDRPKRRRDADDDDDDRPRRRPRRDDDDE